jgi:gentisate 1,2-dioxygenase
MIDVPLVPSGPAIAASSLEGLRSALTPHSFMAGWNKLEPSLWREPRTSFVPMHWRWAAAKQGLDAAGQLISTELADRRNLFMVNRVPDNHYATLRTLVSAYQMILPGERARSHRHSPNALRLVLDVGDETYTVVDSGRLDMRAGDVVLTPGWCWHGHANDGDRPGYWIDFLDVPLVHLLEPMFFEPWSAGFQTPTVTSADSPLVFSWESTARRLDTASTDPTGRHGTRVELGPTGLHTMTLYMERMQAGGSTRPYRTTANQILAVVSGRGATVIADQRVDWEAGDVLAIPSWHRFEHEAGLDSVLFTVSDEAALRALGLFREAD